MRPLLLLPLLLLACGVSGELFTALVDLEQLLYAERQVALHLRQFVDDQAQRLRSLLLYVECVTDFLCLAGNVLQSAVSVCPYRLFTLFQTNLDFACIGVMTISRRALKVYRCGLCKKRSELSTWTSQQKIRHKT